MTFEKKDTLLKRISGGAICIILIFGFMHNMKLVSSNSYHYATIVAAVFALVAEYISYGLYDKEEKPFFDPMRIFVQSILVMIILNLAFG